MHMADALISPVVGIGMWGVSVGLIGLSAKKIQTESDSKMTPLMGVMGAFIFAVQMINFTIPGTGSSGHLAGGLILAILLGPYSAFLTIASVLLIQAIFFADGGLLALGCNIFNMGFFPVFIAYPLIYKKIVMKDNLSNKRIIVASVLSAVVALQLGAMFVSLETVVSGITEIPIKTFFLLMQPIHFAIGLVEGGVTAGLIIFVLKIQPNLFDNVSNKRVPNKKTIFALSLMAVFIGAFLSWFASTHPDGLEWSIYHSYGKDNIENTNSFLHNTLAKIQSKTSILPDYSLPEFIRKSYSGSSEDKWPKVDSGTSISGIVGGGVTLLLVFFIGFILKKKKSLV